MKRKFLLTCLLGMATLSALAKGDITGTVLNKASGEPMDASGYEGDGMEG